MKYLKYLPIIILALFLVNLLVNFATGNIIFKKQNYIAFGFISATLLLFLIKKEFGFMLAGVTLLLGSLSLISVFSTVYFFSIKNIVTFDLIFVLIFVFYLFIFKKDIPRWIEGK